MIKQLQNIFLTLVTNTSDSDNVNNDYQWFMTNEHEVIGIHKDELTAKDTSLLNTFLTPYHIRLPLLTAEEKKWQNRIHSLTSHTNVPLENVYRFVYFSIKKNQINPQLFKEAIHELFAKQVSILWENEQQGIIIEERTITEDSISYEQIIDVLMSDLYVKINFFVGPFHESLTNVRQYYLSLIKSAETAFMYASKPVATYIEAIPYMLIDQADPNFRTEITTTVLQDLINDEEMLKTIEMFIQCNLNISVTAKQLYMHRNSLQYRLDKFIEKTGIDVRKFHHALTVYLALVAKK